MTNVYILGEGDDEAQWQKARQPLFHYINRMGDFYWNMLASNGYEKEVTQSRAAWKERDMESAMSAISKQMVQDIQVIGPVESIAEQLKARSDLGADIQLISMPSGSTEAITNRLESFVKF